MNEITKTKTTTTAQSPFKTPLLLGGWGERAAGNCIDTGKLFAFGMVPQTWGELFHLQSAAVQRLLQQQQAWFEGCADWNRERAAIRGANTVTKLVEQEFNLAAQLCQLAANQATNLVALLENIDVAYAYWLREKLGPFAHASWRERVSA